MDTPRTCRILRPTRAESDWLCDGVAVVDAPAHCACPAIDDEFERLPRVNALLLCLRGRLANTASAGHSCQIEGTDARTPGTASVTAHK